MKQTIEALNEIRAGVDEAMIEKTIKNIKGSYGNKYPGKDYDEFKHCAKKPTIKMI